MPRKNVKRKNRIEPLDPWKIHYLITGQEPENPESPFDVWKYCSQKSKEAKRDWRKNKDWIVKDFISKHPGQRPWAWWVFDAPRWSKLFNGAWFENKLPEPRQRIGGTGTPDFECMIVLPAFNFGIPKHWSLTQSLLKHFSDNFKGVPLDLDDPPIYESQSYYLKRHNLLTKSEDKRLKPKDFEPESCLKYVKNT